jgi:hypothetical protein
MLRLVSVASGLDNVKAHLSSQGYEVVDQDSWPRSVEAVVYSGPQLPVGSGTWRPAAENTVLVNASGLTPEEVASELASRLT